jgi:imidazolonepropionase-like amidohydrolase
MTRSLPPSDQPDTDRHSATTTMIASNLQRLLPSPRAMLAASALAATATLTGAQAKVVIEAGRIVTQAGPDIVDGVIVVEDGRITAIGPADDVETPWDATVIGGPELTATPGFVEANTSSGLDRSNENLDVTPYLDVQDSIDPVSFFFEDCLRWGITTVNVQQGNRCVIGAQGMIVRPVGMTVEEMAVRPHHGVKMSASPKPGKSRATQARALRRAFEDLRTYLEEVVQEKRDGKDYARREALYQGRDLEGEKAKGRGMEGSAWKVEGLELVPRGEIDEKQEPLLEIVEGRQAVYVYCSSPMDVRLALDVARENGFLAHTTLLLHERCWKAADLIAEAGVPVVLEGDQVHVERDPFTGEEVETFVPGVLQENGIRFALSSGDSSTRSLWFQAALAVGYGLDPEVARAAVTKTPAEILGLGKEVGSLEVGKLGNVVLFSGDPMSITSWVEHVVIEGEEVYDRTKDVRNKHLLEGVQPPGTMAAPPEDDTEDAEDE